MTNIRIKKKETKDGTVFLIQKRRYFFFWKTIEHVSGQSEADDALSEIREGFYYNWAKTGYRSKQNF